MTKDREISVLVYFLDIYIDLYGIEKTISVLFENDCTEEEIEDLGFSLTDIERVEKMTPEELEAL